jgi:hypothetical protein
MALLQYLSAQAWSLGSHAVGTPFNLQERVKEKDVCANPGPKWRSAKFEERRGRTERWLGWADCVRGLPRGRLAGSEVGGAGMAVDAGGIGGMDTTGKEGRLGGIDVGRPDESGGWGRHTGRLAGMKGEEAKVRGSEEGGSVGELLRGLLGAGGCAANTERRTDE